MRILISAVGRDTNPTGICRVSASHAKALLANRAASRVILAIGSWQEELFHTLLGSDSSRIEFVPAKIKNSSISRNLWHVATLPKLAERISANLVHLSYPVPTFRRSFTGPIVVTLHDLYPYDIPENFGFPNYLANRAILRQCLSSVDGIACVSNTTRSRLEAIFPEVSRRVPTVVTKNYVETPFGTPVQPASLQEMQPHSFVLTVAQHRKNKNLDLLIRSFSKLPASEMFPGFLVVVGTEGPETESLHRLCNSLGVKERVKFVHSLLETELRWLYANCSVFVACSSVEGYCLPLVEAQANKAKVICSDIPIFREIGDPQCNYFSLACDAVHNLSEALKSGLDRAPVEARPEFQSRKPSVLAEYSKLYSRVLPASASKVVA